MSNYSSESSDSSSRECMDDRYWHVFLCSSIVTFLFALIVVLVGKTFSIWCCDGEDEELAKKKRSAVYRERVKSKYRTTIATVKENGVSKSNGLLEHLWHNMYFTECLIFNRTG